MSDATKHTRTVTWGDPAAFANLRATHSGAEFFHAVRAGELPVPPILALLGVQFTEVGEGRIVCSLTPAEYHYNPLGVVHGGVTSTLLDTAMACAVHTLLPQGTSYTSLEIKVNFVRAITIQTGPIFCEGVVLHKGGTIATAEGRVTDSQGKLYAHGTTTCLIMRA